jgi:hypothetical protein
MGVYFGPPGSADHFVPNSARWKLFGFGSQALCFFGKAGFKGLGLFQTAMQHDKAPAYGSDPNMQMAGCQFPRAQNSQICPAAKTSVHRCCVQLCTFAAASAPVIWVLSESHWRH